MMEESAMVYEEVIEHKKTFYFFVKRMFDLLFSVIGLLLLIPMVVLIKIAYMLTGDFHSIFFKQKRVGKNGKIFYLCKFRTMVPNAEQILKEWLENNPDIREEYYKMRKLDKDPRITKIGKILRISSLDELPQVINILSGDMSLIGPRPLLEGELDEHFGNHKIYESVRPGLSGWWAANGRSITTYEERLQLEYYYIENCSLALDMKCLFKTIQAVIKRTGAK